jgi:tetratricopeptide (TPR) repeat protein
MKTNPQMKRIRKCLFSFFALGVILSCARAPQKQVTEISFIPLLNLDAKKNIRLHSLYAMPREDPLGPGIPLGVSEGLDSEKVRKSIVRLIHGEGASRIVSSGFFVTHDKIATNIHVVAAADLDSLRVRSRDTDYAIQGIIAFDAQNDLVILDISGEGVPLVLGDSETVSSGDTVFSVGYFIDRYNVMKNSVDFVQHNGTCFQMTSNIPSGSSGGPVLNTQGKVIGVNVAGFGLSGYAIVSNALKTLLAQSGTRESLGQWQKRESVRAYAYLVQGLRESHAGDYVNAIEAFNKSIALNPSYIKLAMTYNNRGYAKSLLGHIDFNSGYVEKARRYHQAAIEDFDKTISLNPEYIFVYANRGYAKSLLGHIDFNSGYVEKARQYYQAAIEDFDKTISLNPESPVYTDRGVTKVSLGLSKTNQGRAEEAQQYYQAAIEDFDKTISLNPEDAYTYGNRGYARICLGDFESGRGNTDRAKNLYKAAIADSDPAIQFDSENPYYYHTRGVAKAVLDDYSGAVNDFNKTLSLKSDFARAYYNRALAKAVLGQQDAAKVDFEKARELGLDVGK